MGYSPWGRYKSVATERLHFYFSLSHNGEGNGARVLRAGVPALPSRRKWQPTPVFLPGDSQGQRNLVGGHLWGRTESDTTEAT